MRFVRKYCIIDGLIEFELPPLSSGRLLDEKFLSSRFGFPSRIYKKF